MAMLIVSPDEKPTTSVMHSSNLTSTIWSSVSKKKSVRMRKEYDEVQTLSTADYLIDIYPDWHYYCMGRFLSVISHRYHGSSVVEMRLML